MTASLLAACSGASPITFSQVAALSAPPADHRVPYGDEPLQFGELRLPDGPGPHPLVVIIHGGCWQSEYDLRHIAPLAEAFARSGIAAWTPEYRRIGDPGGGWPGTFQDVVRATDHVRELARKFPVDSGRIVLVGHSAGGHLALWLAARRNLPPASHLVSPEPLPVRGVVGLAPITDLRSYGAGTGDCNASVAQLLGGTPEQVPDRYAHGSPSDLLPLGVPQRLIQGSRDPIVPAEQSQGFAALARQGGDDSQVILLPEAGHFDVVAPFAPAWRRVLDAVRDLLRTS